MGESADFDSLAMVHLGRIYRAALALCGRPDQAEDLVQTTFVRALERFESFRPGTNCKAWLLRILRNVYIDQIRHRVVVGPEVSIDETLLAGRPAEPEDSEELQEPALHKLLEKFSDEQVIRALARLPEDQRLVLLLVDVEQMSHEDVAHVLDVAVGTVKSRASRARARMKDALRAHAKDLGFMGRDQ